MNKRSMTACVLALALLAVSGRVAFAQEQLPAGWVRNWDGSNTYVFLGSPGTGNVGYHPGKFDISQADYSRRHPGWYQQLVAQTTRDWYGQNRDRAGAGWDDRLTPDEESRIRPGQRLDSDLRQRVHWVPDDLAQRYGPPPSGYRYGVIGGHVVLLDNNYQVRDVYYVDRGTGGYAQDQLPAGWIRNWDGSNTYVFLGSPGTGNVGYHPGKFDISQADYSRRHPGWYQQLVPQITRDWYHHNRDHAGAGWDDRLTPDEERYLRPGQRLDSGLRQRSHPLSADLSKRYRPAPSGYRYVVIGGHVLLVDNNYQVHESYQIDLQ